MPHRLLPLAFVPVVASLVLADAGPVRAAASFDAFFAGMDAACEVSPQFADWRSGLAAKFVPGAAGTAPVAPSADVASSIGPVTSIDAGDHMRITAPLDGTFRGLKLSRVVFYFGKENGIFGWALEFAEEPARVKKVLGKSVAKGNAQMARTNEVGASTGFDFAKGRVALFCDFSN